MPVDLGLGLMGELGHLTEGLFDAPGASSLPGAQKTPAAPKAYQKLSKEKYKDFEDRITKFLKDEEAELEKMKAEHSEKMAELTKSKTYVQAERRLRDAAFSDARNTRRKSESQAGSPVSEDEDLDVKVNEVVEDVEKSLGVTIAPRKNVNCVEKGGLVEEPPAPAPTNGNEANGAENLATNGESNGSVEDSAMDGDNSMFDTTDFSAFDSAGDALADYTGGDDLDLGLEGDAFGDAFHGTETRNDVDDDGANS
ncbi:hypothetical protein UCRNP2_4252 [Neofusicoccum parvum UCRNP2]|uniref:SWI/SNF and RSC complexes subunit Ssr4 C-terminal domain-containing protein n=1 Tax=Botryosphaeria parva (strain UCR-NP2) TaxID=1287680 RepID=R1GKY5_BOTPV|nr:hypothetical protein UCRNP2_4252 [Neofusicoccum parvum UCRNP2]